MHLDKYDLFGWCQHIISKLSIYLLGFLRVFWWGQQACGQKWSGWYGPPVISWSGWKLLLVNKLADAPKWNLLFPAFCWSEGGCCNKIICTLLLSLLRVRLKYLLLLPTAYMNLRLEQELPVCDSTLTQRDKVCGWTVHTNEFIELLSVLDTTDKSGRDYGSIAISFSSLHKYCWWAGFVYLMQNMRGRIWKKIIQNSTDPLWLRSAVLCTCTNCE